MTDDDLCPMSDLPPDQCALPCHKNLNLPAEVAPEARCGALLPYEPPRPQRDTRLATRHPAGVAYTLTPAAATQHETRDTRPRPKKSKRPAQACRFVDGVWVTREHVRDCDDHVCEGCKPCQEDHCALFGSCPNHVDLDAGVVTCASCVGDFRNNLGEVVTLTTLVHLELEHASVSADPGHDVEEVVNLSGPFADPDQIDARRGFLNRYYDRRGWCDWPRLALFDVDEQHHPVEVLARWERDLRREYEQPETDDIPAQWPLPHTVQRDVLTRSVDYLLGMLDRSAFPHDEPFEACARDVRRLRTHLEGVLSDSRAPETGAPCPTCGQSAGDRKPPRLVKRYGHWCDDPNCERLHDATGKDDRWVCPDNSDHWWSDEDYRKFVAGAYLAHSDRLTASQIQDQYGINAWTVHKWAARGKFRPVGRAKGALLYRVQDVLAQRSPEKEQANA